MRFFFVLFYFYGFLGQLAEPGSKILKEAASETPPLPHEGLLELFISVLNFRDHLGLSVLALIRITQLIDKIFVVLEPAEFVELVDGVDVAPIDEQCVYFFGEEVVLFDQQVQDLGVELHEAGLVGDFIGGLAGVVDSPQNGGG